MGQRSTQEECKTEMVNFCRACDNIEKVNHGYIDFVCGCIDKMSVEEYEDYFIDNVKPCPYFSVKGEQNDKLSKCGRFKQGDKEQPTHHP